MANHDLNPYQPPEAQFDRPQQPRRFRVWVLLVRATVAMIGLTLLTGWSWDHIPLRPPTRFAETAPKVLGAFLMLAAVFPLGQPREKSVDDPAVGAEEL